MAAVLIAGLALTLVGGLPVPVPGGNCSCCDRGTCLLTGDGCDHRQPGGRTRMTSCCLGAAAPPGKAASTRLSELEAAILCVSSAQVTAAVVAWQSPAVLRFPAAPALRPEPPPPRALSV